VKKIIINSAGFISALALIAQSATLDAGVFQNIASAANGALPGYGRSAGLREALRVGCDNVVQKLESDSSYLLNSSTRIRLPSDMVRLQKIAARLGYTKAFDELEIKINRAAFNVVPATRDELQGAIDELKITQARAILNGSHPQATRLLEQSFSVLLEDRLLPEVKDSLSQLKVTEASERLLKRLSPIGGISSVGERADIENVLARHVAHKSVAGFFRHLEKEELAIRNNPINRTTALLRRVFG